MEFYQFTSLVSYGVDVDALYPLGVLDDDYLKGLRYDTHPDYIRFNNVIMDDIIHSVKTKKLNDYKNNLRVLKYSLRENIYYSELLKFT